MPGFISTVIKMGNYHNNNYVCIFSTLVIMEGKKGREKPRSTRYT